MSVIGIVAEYNPFHLGHQYHIRRSRELLGEESTVVCVMSGDFVQRGEAAIWPKSVRAEAACRCGADLVVELPLPWCLASAEGFARGAVSLLEGMGCTHLSFGSEAGALAPLQELAEALVAPETNEEIRAILSEDPRLSYAAARQRAAELRCGETAKLLETPNNILGVEYLKAIRQLALDLQPLTIKRQGSRHDGAGGEYPSAAELRALLREGNTIDNRVPREAAELFHSEQRPDPALLETALLARLRVLPQEDFENLPDAAGGLGRRLYQAAREEPTLETIAEAAKSKRYAHSRIRRMLCCAALGIHDGMTAEAPPYARVLAANGRGCELLKQLRGGELPVLTKPSAVREWGGRALEVFSLGAQAHDLYKLAMTSPEKRRGGMDWRTGPVLPDMADIYK